MAGTPTQAHDGSLTMPFLLMSRLPLGWWRAMTARRLRTVGLALVAVILCPAAVAAQGVRGVVVDQTELPLPGVRIEVLRQGAVVDTVQTQGNGTFEIATVEPDDQIQAMLDGFEISVVPVSRATRIVLFLAKATEVTEVHGSLLAESGAGSERMGGALRPVEIVRMPTAHPRALETLPRLPAVMRAPDGHLTIDGAPPREGSLWIDGFDVTDPVTGASAIDLPVEAIRGVAVIRGPMAAAFGGTLGGLASIETTAGSDEFVIGVQSFIPRIRLSDMGLGRIEAFFPRAYVAGRTGRVRYLAAEEFSLERVAVPGITSSEGRPNIDEVSATSFGRVDIEFSRRHTVTLESIFVPRKRVRVGLSPVRDESAAPSESTRDVFAGAISRLLLGAQDVVTTRVGWLGHGTVLTPPGEGRAARLTPFGWRDNWFSNVDHWGVRQSLATTWDHAGVSAFGMHTISTSLEVQRRGMRATMRSNPTHVEDLDGRLVRLIEHGAGTRLQVAETTGAIGLADSWVVNDRLQVDFGARVDWSFRAGPPLFAPRAAVRYKIDAEGRTSIKFGAGRFVGRTPLAGLAFGSFGARSETFFDPMTGDAESVFIYQPTLERLRQPRADSVMLEAERQLGAGLDVQMSVRQRLGSNLPIVTVPAGGGLVRLDSSGRSTYRELQVSVRKSWGDRAQAFASYVRADARAELNEFGTLFDGLDAAILQPGGQASTNDHVPHRLTTWGTMSLPGDFVVSPAFEWHSGYPYSEVDVHRQYAGTPNGARLPTYVSLDLTIFRTFGLGDRRLDLGIQVFDVTNHYNPRDVYPVVGTPGPHFTNSIGRAFGGYMMVNWKSSAKPVGGA